MWHKCHNFGPLWNLLSTKKINCTNLFKEVRQTLCFFRAISTVTIACFTSRGSVFSTLDC